jgi:hypothetical protein
MIVSFLLIRKTRGEDKKNIAKKISLNRDTLENIIDNIDKILKQSKSVGRNGVLAKL